MPIREWKRSASAGLAAEAPDGYPVVPDLVVQGAPRDPQPPGHLAKVASRVAQEAIELLELELFQAPRLAARGNARSLRRGQGGLLQVPGGVGHGDPGRFR